MDRKYNSFLMSFFDKYVVTAANAFELPPAGLEELAEIFPRYLFHTATSRIRSVL